MSTKKWRPFWSYDVEKTERFLSGMAAAGNQLVNVNRWTRIFTFKEAKQQKVDYQIVYDKTKNKLPRRLKESGWENEWHAGNWKFLKNTRDTVRSFPVREGILKRNRFHSSIATGIAILSGTQALMMMTILFVIVSVADPFDGKGQIAWGFGIPLIQSIAFVVLAVYAAKKLRAFERRYFSSAIDDEEVLGQTIVKWRFGWMNEPDLLEKWLSAKALEGYQLTRIKGARFIFKKGKSKHVSYVYDYQWKASPNYYDIHKGAGWQLKFTSPYSVAKSALWMKEYEIDEEKPQLTYEIKEKKALVRKILLTTGGLTVYLIGIGIFGLWLNIPLYAEQGWSLLGKAIVSMFCLSLLVSLWHFIRSLKYLVRMRNV